MSSLPQSPVSTAGCWVGLQAFFFQKQELGSQDCILILLGPAALRS